MEKPHIDHRVESGEELSQRRSVSHTSLMATDRCDEGDVTMTIEILPDDALLEIFCWLQKVAQLWFPLCWNWNRD
jgi:hypothetical protein